MYIHKNPIVSRYCNFLVACMYKIHIKYLNRRLKKEGKKTSKKNGKNKYKNVANDSYAQSWLGTPKK